MLGLQSDSCKNLTEFDHISLKNLPLSNRFQSTAYGMYGLIYMFWKCYYMCDAQYNKVTITDESPSYIFTLHAINIFVRLVYNFCFS